MQYIMQVWSMEGKVVSEEGVKFKSNVDGSTYFCESPSPSLGVAPAVFCRCNATDEWHTYARIYVHLYVCMYDTCVLFVNDAVHEMSRNQLV